MNVGKWSGLNFSDMMQRKLEVQKWQESQWCSGRAAASGASGLGFKPSQEQGLSSAKAPHYLWMVTATN
jgi:hypothetical protein